MSIDQSPADPQERGPSSCAFGRRLRAAAVIVVFLAISQGFGRSVHAETPRTEALALVGATVFTSPDATPIADGTIESSLNPSQLYQARQDLALERRIDVAAIGR